MSYVNLYETCCCTICTTLGCNCHTVLLMPVPPRRQQTGPSILGKSSPRRKFIIENYIRLLLITTRTRRTKRPPMFRSFRRILFTPFLSVRFPIFQRKCVAYLFSLVPSQRQWRSVASVRVHRLRSDRGIFRLQTPEIHDAAEEVSGHHRVRLVVVMSEVGLR